MNKPIYLILGSAITPKRQGLDAQPDIIVVAQAKTTDEAIHLTQQYRPNVVILDSISTDKKCLAATRQILKSLPDTKIIIIAAEHIGEYAVKAVEAGASGYLPQKVETNELLSAVRTIAQDKTYFYL